MQEKFIKATSALSWSLLALMVAQSSIGLALPAVYHDVAWIKATWFGNDLVTLLLAAPLLAVALLTERRTGLRSVLLHLGLLGYSAYNYAYYLLGARLNVLLPLYVALVLISVVTLIVGLSRIDADETVRAFKPTMPRRLIGGYLAFVALSLAIVWIGLWASHVFAGRPTPIAPEAFKLVAALDLTSMVPLMAFGGVLLWIQNRWGYIVASIAGIQASLYLVVLAVNSCVAIFRGLAAAPGELPVWGTLALLTSIATVALMSNVRSFSDR